MEAGIILNDDFIDPLYWYELELQLEDPDDGTISLQSRSSEQHQALQAATSIKKALDKNYKPPVNIFQACVYLSNDALLSSKHSAYTPIVFDTGASISLTPFIEDFVDGGLEECKDDRINGINSSAVVKGEGWIEWTIRDKHNNVCLVRTRAYYVPSSRVRLFSPQAYCKLHGPGPHGYFDFEKLEFTVANGTKMTFPYTDGNLPLMLLDRSILQAGHTADLKTYCNSTDIVTKLKNILSVKNHNLDGPKKELMLHHLRCGRAGTGWLQELMHKRKGPIGSPADAPILPTKFPSTKSTKFKPDCHCAACLMARQHRRGTNSKLVIAKPDKVMAIRKNVKAPGDMISMDQWISRTPGRRIDTRGREPVARQYHGGTIYYDHYSSFIHIECQVSLKSGETIKGKHRFQSWAKRKGVILRHFRADNHPFNSKEFQDDFALFDQDITFSGVGAHHQNGVAERAIQTVTYWARAMMMHQLHHWPSEYNPNLWALAFEHAVYIWNSLPRSRNGLSPQELFTGVKSASSDPTLTNLRVWGCPAWVLDPRLQDGHKIPKFTPRSRCGMYVGSSPKHSDTIGRVLNLTTGHISSQFHVVYDEQFSTAVGELDKDKVLDAETFRGLIEFEGRSDYLDPEDRANPRVMRIATDIYESFPKDNDLEAPLPEGDDLFSLDEDGNPRPENGNSASEGAQDQSPEGASKPYVTRYGRKVKQFRDPIYATLCIPPPKRRSNKRPHAHLQYQAGGERSRKVRCGDLNNMFLHSLDWNPSTFLTGDSVDTKRALARLMENLEEGNWDPMALAAKSNSADTYTYAEAMNGPNRDGFQEAAHLEIDTLRKMGVWDVVEREYWMNVLPSTWTFRVKRFTDGSIRKLKARFCARGDRQIENVDFFDTWAPVVSWNTVRLMLVLSCLCNLKSKQVDYTAAFVHADIDKPPNWNSMTQDEKVGGVSRDAPGISRTWQSIETQEIYLRITAKPQAMGGISLQTSGCSWLPSRYGGRRLLVHCRQSYLSHLC